MREVFKITKHKYDYKVAPELIYDINKVMGANDFRLSKNRSHHDLKFSFTNRIVNIWNSLPNAIVDVGKVFRIGTVRYHWPMSAHASQAFSIASCTDSEDLP